MDDPMLGSPARTAVVTATLPQISVVYLVFKGSSFMMLCKIVTLHHSVVFFLKKGNCWDS